MAAQLEWTVAMVLNLNNAQGLVFEWLTRG